MTRIHAGALSLVLLFALALAGCGMNAPFIAPDSPNEPAAAAPADDNDGRGDGNTATRLLAVE